MLIDVRGGVHAEDIFNFCAEDPNSVWRNLIGVVEQNQVIPGIGSIGTFRYRGRSNERHRHRGQRPDRVGRFPDQGVGLLHHRQPRPQVRLHDFWRPDLQLARAEQRLQHPHAERHPEPDHRAAESVHGDQGRRPRGDGRLRPGPVDRQPAHGQCGLRFDYNHTGWDEYHFGPGPLVPNRNFTVEEEDFYKFKDLSPRVGGAYDIFGNGRTAIKANIGKYGLARSDPGRSGPRPDCPSRDPRHADRFDPAADCDLINRWPRAQPRPGASTPAGRSPTSDSGRNPPRDHL